MAFKVQYRNTVKKELRELTQPDRLAVIEKIQSLKDDPRPKHSAKLKGSRDLFRIRHGDFRVIYQVQKRVLIVLVIRVGHRREVYKNL